VADLEIVERQDTRLATIMARKGVTAEAVGAALGLFAPDRPAIAINGDFGLIGTGPGMWLAMGASPSGQWMTMLRGTLGELASISDQSAAYLVFRMRGALARELLQRGAHVDLHPSMFGPGAAATTVIAHIGVILWQLDDSPTFEVAIFRSFADSFRAWIAAAREGLREVEAA
jgi:methylglutamate dehydrogenase subunit D